jgi:hypothetical protein
MEIKIVNGKPIEVVEIPINQEDVANEIKVYEEQIKMLEDQITNAQARIDELKSKQIAITNAVKAITQTEIVDKLGIK